MTLRKAIIAGLTALLVIASFGTNPASAQFRRFFSRRAPEVSSDVVVAQPAVVSAPVVVATPPVVVAPPVVAGYPPAFGGPAGVQAYQYGVPNFHPAYAPIYNPYVAPYPWYAILPPSLPYGYGQGQGGQYDEFGNRRKTAEDYNYSSRDFDTPPRKRPPTAEPARQMDRQADIRRVRIELTVPTQDAVVIIDGAKTKQTGINRVFITPPLLEDRIFTSTIEVQWNDGTARKATKTLEYFPGETVRHVFKAAD